MTGVQTCALPISPLAKYIEDGYAERQDRDYRDFNYAREGQIEPNSGVKRFKK